MIPLCRTALVWLLPVLLMSGCMSRRARIDSLFEQGLPGLACDAADYKATEQVERLTWENLDLKVAMAPVPAEAFGVPVRGYGDEWVLMELAINRRPGVVHEVAVYTRLDGWAPCDTCTSEWMAYQLGEAGETRDLPRPVARGGGRRGKRGGLLKGLAAIGKVIAAPLVLIVTGSIDLATLPGDLSAGRKGFGLTGKAIDWLADDGAGRTSGSGVRFSPLSVQGTSVLCATDGACAGMMPYRRYESSGDLRMNVTVRTAGTSSNCAFSAAQVVPPPVGADPAIVQSYLPDTGWSFVPDPVVEEAW